MIGKRRLLASTARLCSWRARASAGPRPSIPSEPIKWVVPRAPGGGTDILARLLQPGPGEEARRVDHRRQPARRRRGDGRHHRHQGQARRLHLLSASDNSFYQNPAILDSLPYDTLKDFTAVTMLAQGPVILLVHPDVPAKTLPELIALAKKTQLTYASGGIGASTHLVGVMLNLQAGTNITHMPFKGSGPALIALLGGHVSMQFGGISSAAPYIKDGKVRAIAARRRPSRSQRARRADLPGKRR